MRYSPHPIQDLFKRCGHSSLRVLGSLNPCTVPDRFDPALLVTLTDRRRFPQLHCSDEAMAIQIILYDRPDPSRMQYLSLAPMSLALGDKADFGRWDPAVDSLEEEDEREKRKRKMLVEKLKLHTVVSRPPSQKELLLPLTIDQVNCSSELNDVLQRNTGMIGTRLKRGLSVSERVVESANDLWDYLYIGLCYILTWIRPVAARLFIVGLMSHRVAAELVLRLLNWRPQSTALKDVSATAQQVDIRLQQFCYWPIQYLTLRRRKATWESVTNSHPEYIRFYNSLWLVANDVIIGIALGSYIVENSTFVASQVDKVISAWSIEGLRDMISWLMEWPGGLKLNNELAEFLGDLFIWVIDHWAGKSMLLGWTQLTE